MAAARAADVSMASEAGIDRQTGAWQTTRLDA